MIRLQCQLPTVKYYIRGKELHIMGLENRNVETEILQVTDFDCLIRFHMWPQTPNFTTEWEFCYNTWSFHLECCQKVHVKRSTNLLRKSNFPNFQRRKKEGVWGYIPSRREKLNFRARQTNISNPRLFLLDLDKHKFGEILQINYFTFIFLCFFLACQVQSKWKIVYISYYLLSIIIFLCSSSLNLSKIVSISYYFSFHLLYITFCVRKPTTDSPLNFLPYPLYASPRTSCLRYCSVLHHTIKF